jgi:hypothetical protein
MDVRFEHSKIQLGKFQHLFLSSFWLGYQFFISAVTMIIIPVEVAKVISPDYRSFALGISILF